jgi:hypothetical protein
MATINIGRYKESLRYNSIYLTLVNLPKLELFQIEQFEEPYRKFLYAYYGYIAQLDNYTIDQLNEDLYISLNNNDDIFYDDQYKDVYTMAIISNNLKTIKYLHSRNINYDYYIYGIGNTYNLAINLGYLKIIKYYDSNNIIFYTNEYPKSYLSASGNSGLLKMIKYFELKAKDAPNFELQIINCYINAATGKAKIRILKYLETKYPLYITEDIIYIGKRYMFYNSEFKKIKYLNRNYKYLNYNDQYLILRMAYKGNIAQIMKYLFSHINELIIRRYQYAKIFQNIELKFMFKQIGNYLIRYRTKYMLCYIGGGHCEN